MRGLGRTWALVLAGGDGRRLESLTTDPHGITVPKQYCSLLGGPSLLRLALYRGARVARRERIAVVVAAQHDRWWSAELAHLPASNAVVQPLNRGTAVGLLLPLLHILWRDPQATVLVLPSDHYVVDEQVLETAVRKALLEVELSPRYVLLLGITPDQPDPQLGWIVPGEAGERGLNSVDCFVEKPAPPVARDLMDVGALWNSFILVAWGQTLLELFRQRLPGVTATLLKATYSAGRRAGDLTAVYEDLPGHDFSREVLQGAERLLRVLPVPPCGWSDLGTPERVARCVQRVPRWQEAPGAAPGLSPMVLASRGLALQG